MRIIAGHLKGRVIKAVPGKETRPTSDKIKEAIFHKLGPYFSGGTCLDLFAGSGSLGIEAISRGMEYVTFIEKSNQAIKTIHQNIGLLQIADRCDVFRNDALKALHILSSKKKQFDLILVDPPYEKVSYQKVIQTIATNDVLRTGGKMYIESASNEKIEYNPAFFSVYYEKKYSGTTSVMILEKIEKSHAMNQMRGK